MTLKTRQASKLAVTTPFFSFTRDSQSPRMIALLEQEVLEGQFSIVTTLRRPRRLNSQEVGF
jgi:hypothetical protein